MSNGVTNKTGKTPVFQHPTEATELVVRSPVPPSLPYSEYKPYLRADFFHSCAYCTIMESEAGAIRFTIDHYEPQKKRTDLVNEYSNLLWCCDTCNTRKGERSPPPEARKAGKRFFRPDQDLRRDHFERREIWVEPKSEVGKFTITMLDLNRAGLKRIRELRQRLSDCNQFVIEGIMGLRRYPMDTLPANIRARAKRKIEEAMGVAEEIGEAIDAILREQAKSSLIDPDPEAAIRDKAREAYIKESEGMFPGIWSSPRKRQARRINK